MCVCWPSVLLASTIYQLFHSFHSARRPNSIYPIFESSKSVSSKCNLCSHTQTHRTPLGARSYARCNKYINRIFVYYHFSSTFLKNVPFISSHSFLNFLSRLVGRLSSDPMFRHGVIFYPLPFSDVRVQFLLCNHFFRFVPIHSSFSLSLVLLFSLLAREKWTTWAAWMKTINIWKHIRFTVEKIDRANQYSLIFLSLALRNCNRIVLLCVSLSIPEFGIRAPSIPKMVAIRKIERVLAASVFLATLWLRFDFMYKLLDVNA